VRDLLIGGVSLFVVGNAGKQLGTPATRPRFWDVIQGLAGCTQQTRHVQSMQAHAVGLRVVHRLLGPCTPCVQAADPYVQSS
jgi:hypothetical protein